MGLTRDTAYWVGFSEGLANGYDLLCKVITELQ